MEELKMSNNLIITDKEAFQNQMVTISTTIF